jgi:hypothetical protein
MSVMPGRRCLLFGDDAEHHEHRSARGLLCEQLLSLEAQRFAGVALALGPAELARDRDVASCGLARVGVGASATSGRREVWAVLEDCRDVGGYGLDVDLAVLADAVPTLRTPDGRHYQTDDATEVTNLTLGHGYTRDPENTDDAEQPPARPRSRRTTPPATAEHADTPTVAGETTD